MTKGKRQKSGNSPPYTLIIKLFAMSLEWFADKRQKGVENVHKVEKV